MNAQDPQMQTEIAQDKQVQTRVAAKALFPVENLQHLDASSAARCQDILCHGSTFGIWLTPEVLAPHLLHTTIRTIDIRLRLKAFLPPEIPDSPNLDTLLDEGLLYVTRLALLMRTGPAGLRGASKGKPIDVTTITTLLFTPVPKLVARGIVRRLAAGPESGLGFASALTPDDLTEFHANKWTHAELRRIKAFHDRGLWLDTPPKKAAFKGKPTAVRGHGEIRPEEKKGALFLPLPDDYLAEMGPRVLWVIKDLGPNLIHLLQTLPELLGDRRFENIKSNNPINARIARYFDNNIWRDRHGRIISEPPFELRHGTRAGRSKRQKDDLEDIHPWPPKHWWSVQRLAVTLQRAHLWLAFIVLTSRQGEMLTLKRDCLGKADDGQWYLKGLTYKPTRRQRGKTKESPPPQVLVDAIAQQAQLVEASESLARLIDGTGEIADLATAGTNLWASLGVGSSDATRRLTNASAELYRLAETIGMDPKPRGKNIHPHRMRKSLARLAGIAIDGSQKVLMLLLGHDDVATTLSYMQSDPAFAKEIDDVTRELRILRAEGLITDMHAALHTPGSLSYGGHGGGGASVLSQGVQAYEQQLHREGKDWSADSARELAVLLTNNGESTRLVAPHVICTLGPTEKGACSQKKGSIVTANCQVTCNNHIEEATGRRDTQRIIPILVQNAQQDLADGHWLAAENDKRQLRHELSRYEDIGAEWRSKSEVKALLEAEGV